MQNNEEQTKSDTSKEQSKVTQPWPRSMPSAYWQQASHSHVEPAGAYSAVTLPDLVRTFSFPICKGDFSLWRTCLLHTFNSAFSRSLPCNRAVRPTTPDKAVQAR